MPGLVPGIHEFKFTAVETWMAGPSPAEAGAERQEPDKASARVGGTSPAMTNKIEMKRAKPRH
jgi:hypothetical protein